VYNVAHWGSKTQRDRFSFKIRTIISDNFETVRDKIE